MFLDCYFHACLKRVNRDFMTKTHINGFVKAKDADYEVVRKAAALVK